MFILVTEPLDGKFLGQTAEQMQRPEGFQRRLTLVGADEFDQCGRGGGVAAPSKLEHGAATHPAVGIVEQGHLFFHREGGDVAMFVFRMRAGGFDAIHATAFLVPVVYGTHMTEPGIVPIAHVDAAIGPDSGEYRTKPAVVGFDEVGFIDGPVGRGVRKAFADPDHVVERVGRDDFAIESLGVESAFIDAEGLGEAILVALVFHVLEVAESVGIGQRPVFAPAFDAVTALRVIHAPSVAVVGAGEDATLGIDFETKSVAAAFAVDLEFLGVGMIAPHHLSLPGDGLAGGGVFDLPGGGGAVDSIEPAIGTPLQVVHHRMRVLDAETGQSHFRVRIGNVVAIGIGIEQQVGRIAHPDPAVTDGHRGGNVEPGDDILVGVENAVAIRVFKDRDFIRALGSVRRSLGDFIKLSPQVIVVFDDL